jgi:hypothetical protein
MNTAVENKTSIDTGAGIAHEVPDGMDRRLRSERIAAQGIRLGAGKAGLKYVLPLIGLAVLASVAFTQA